MNTTNPDGDGKREAVNLKALALATLADNECRTCDGYGYISCNKKRNRICRACSGTGLAPQFLVQHPDFKREQLLTQQQRKV